MLRSSDNWENVVDKFQCPADHILRNNPHISCVRDLTRGDELCGPKRPGECSTSEYGAKVVIGRFTSSTFIFGLTIKRILFVK